MSLDIQSAADAYLNKPSVSEAADQYLNGEHSELNKSPVTVGEEQFKPAEPPKIQPDFLKSLEMIGSGAMKGSLEFTGRLLSLAEKGLRLGGEPTVVPRAYEYWSDKNKEDAAKYNGAGFLQGLGSVPAEVLTTAPAGGALGLTAKAADLAASAVPVGLKTLAKYGTAAVGGAGVLAGTEGERFDPNNPAQPFSTEQAAQALKNPASYLVPMAGQKFTTWADASRDLAAAKEVIPSIMARELKDPNAASTKFANQFFGFLPALTGMGKQARQVENIGDDIHNFIQGIAKSKEAQTTDDLVALAGNKVQDALSKLEGTEDNLWNKPFISKPIVNPQNIKDDALSAIDLIKGTGIPSESLSTKSIQNALRTGDMTVEDAKRLVSQIGKASVNAAQADNAGAGVELAGQLRQIKDNIMNHIQNSLSPADMADFMAARQFSANKYQLYDNAPLVKKAIENEANAQKLVTNLISEAGVLPPKQAALNMMDQYGDRSSIEAAKLSQALEASDQGGKINLDTFLKKTAEYTQTPKILSSDTYKSLQGLNEYLKNINESSKTGWWKQAAMAATIGGGTLGILTADDDHPLGAALPLASYAAATFVANHSPLKTIFNAMTKNLSDDTYNALVNAAQRHLTRAGYLVQDGVLQHKGEQQ